MNAFDPRARAAAQRRLSKRRSQFENPVPARLGDKTNSTTAALKCYPERTFKVSFIRVRFNGTGTPLDPVGNKTAGDALAVRAQPGLWGWQP